MTDDELIENLIFEFEDIVWWTGDKRQAIRNVLATARPIIAREAREKALEDVMKIAFTFGVNPWARDAILKLKDT